MLVLALGVDGGGLFGCLLLLLLLLLLHARIICYRVPFVFLYLRYHPVDLVPDRAFAILLHNKNDDLLLEALRLLLVLNDLLEVHRLVLQPKRLHDIFQQISFRLRVVWLLSKNVVSEVVAELVRLIRPLLLHPIVFAHVLLVFLLVVVDGPCVLEGVLVSMPVHSCGDQLRVEAWLCLVGD